MIELSKNTIQIVDTLFGHDQGAHVCELLKTQWSENLHFCEVGDQYSMERIRLSALRLSEGQLEKLSQANDLAQLDWRDLLMAADFGEDPKVHERWTP